MSVYDWADTAEEREYLDRAFEDASDARRIERQDARHDEATTSRRNQPIPRCYCNKAGCLGCALRRVIEGWKP